MCTNVCVVYGPATCTIYVAPNEVWNYNGSGTGGYTCAPNSAFPNSVADDIFNENLDRLIGSIADERVRRGIYAYPFSGITGSDEVGDAATVIIGDSTTTADRMREIKTSINELRNYITYNTRTGTDRLSWGAINQARYYIDVLRSECINDGYCSGYWVCSCHIDCSCNY
jgi:hypothetical protein